MNDKRNWTTPKLNPLSGEKAEGAVVPPGNWMNAMGNEVGEAKTNAGRTERQTTGYDGITYYSHTGPS